MKQIVYTGTLDGYDPSHPKYQQRSGLSKYLLPYNSQTTKPFTRSGYFLLRAIRMAYFNNPSLDSLIHFNFYGNIDKVNQDQVKEFGIEKLVDFHGYLPKKELAKLEKKADGFFLPLESGSEEFERPLFIPGKLFEYMKWKKPILCLAPESDVKDILRMSGLGLCFDPDDSDSICKGIVQIAETKDLQQLISPKNDYIASFAFESIAEEYSRLIKDSL